MNRPFHTGRRFAVSAALIILVAFNAALVLALAAHAAPAPATPTTFIGTWSPGKWALSSGTSGTGKTISTHPTEQACRDAGDALAKAAKKAPTYSCKALEVGTYAAAPVVVPPPPTPVVPPPPVVPPVVPVTDPVVNPAPAVTPTPAPALTDANWGKVADENGSFTLTVPAFVKYGAASSFALIALDKGTYTCGNDLFGDPLYGTAKECDVHAGPGIVLPPQPVWGNLVAEGQTFFVTDPQFVRYGAGNQWSQRVVHGAGACIALYFGGDPAWGQAKTCQINTNIAIAVPPEDAPPTGSGSTTAPTSPMPFPDMQHGIKVALDHIPPPNPAPFTEERIRPTDEVAPGPGDIGAMRTVCDFSHFAFDDPIVYPGQPGKSHLHAFFGNHHANGNSTYESLMADRASTCRGGPVNATAYWMPALIDTATGVPQVPLDNGVYYKTGYRGVVPEDVKPFPEGLRMVSGNPVATGYDDMGNGRWKCDVVGGGDSGWSGGIPSNCLPGTGLLFVLSFPQCWDGVNVDSADHKSHMAFADGAAYITQEQLDLQVQGRGWGGSPTPLQWWQAITTTPACPPTHPVALPEIGFNVWFQVPFEHPERIAHDWRLSSDSYDTSLPGGISGHGDWFGAWKRDVLEEWIKGCDNARRDCHSHLTGGGHELY